MKYMAKSYTDRRKTTGRRLPVIYDGLRLFRAKEQYTEL